MRLGLEGMIAFLEKIGNPHLNLNCIHIAGTNGKGSVAAMLSAIFQKGSYRVGLYTSPHLERYTERFKINGVEAGEEQLLIFFQSYASLPEFRHLTYFELATAFAFWWFYRQKADLVMLEVGLGGRLDATNVIEKPMVSVITSIGMDHVDILGPKISDIAREKAGIIKANCPVVTGNLPEDALQVVLNRARETGSDVHKSSHGSVRWQKNELIVEKGDMRMRLKPDLLSNAQSTNVLTVLKTLELLNGNYPLRREDVIVGLESVSQITGFRGRFERLSQTNPWYFDGGHNAEALKSTRDTIERIFPDEKPILVVHLMGDKLNTEIAGFFSEFKEILYYSAPNKRAASFDSFVALVSHAKPLYEDRIGAFLHQNQNKAVLFLGSFYFYSSVKDWVNRFQSDHPFL